MDLEKLLRPGNEAHRFVIRGRFKPYTRMTRRGKFVREDAKIYLASQEAVKWQLKAQMRDAMLDMFPGQTPLQVRIRITHSGGFHNRDLDNEAKALLDTMSGIVYPDDRWIDALMATRERGSDDATEIRVAVLEPPGTPMLSDLDGYVLRVVDARDDADTDNVPPQRPAWRVRFEKAGGVLIWGPVLDVGGWRALVAFPPQ